MAKKIIVGLLLVIFSVLTVAIASFTSLISELSKYVTELIEEEKYTEAYQTVYAGTIMYEEPVHNFEDDGKVIYIYKIVSNFLSDEYVVEEVTEGIEIVIFNVSEGEFDGIDSIKADGYNSKVAASAYAQYYYEDYGIYSILVETSSQDIPNIVLEKDGTSVYEIALSGVVQTNFKFSSEQSAQWSDYINRYEEYYTGRFADAISDSDSDKQSKIEEEYDLLVELKEKNLSDDESFVSMSLDADVITSRSGYVVKTVFTFILVVLTNMIVIFIVFIRGKKKLIPVAKNNQNNKVIETEEK